MVNLAYADFALRSVCEVAGSSLDWLRTRDEATRARAVELQREGMPQGEALAAAWREQEIYWTVVPPPPSPKRPTEQQDMGSPTKVLKTTNKIGNKFLCKRYNDNRGCKKHEKDCPDQRLHRCDALKPSNEVCGSRDHTRLQCPHYSR